MIASLTCTLSDMKNYIYAAVAAIAALTSCQVEELSEGVHEDVSTSGAEFYAVIETDEATRTVMDANNNVLWSADDQVVIFAKNTLPARYQIRSEYVGENYGYFSEVTSGGNSGDFGSSMSLDHNVAYYPYADGIECLKSGSGYALDVVLPSEQTYASESFGSGSFPMVAVSEDVNLTFRNVCGGVMLQLRGNCKVASVSIEGKNNEKLSGKASVTAYPDGSNPVIAMSDDASASVTLDCGEGVQLNADNAVEFIISLPPTTFTNGFAVTITDTDGAIQVIETSKENKVLRSSLLKMPAVDVKTEFKDTPNHQIWYTAKRKVVPNDANAFGAKIISNEYDSQTQRGVITFDGDVTSIGGSAFHWCSSLTGLVIPESVTSIGSFAFYECSSLSDIVIPSSVESIGASAFHYCESLKEVTIEGTYSEWNSGNIFVECTSLEKFHGPMASSDGRCFIVGGTLISFARAGLTEYTIPDGVTSIGGSAFYWCSSLTGIVIPESVTSIESFAFSGCDSLSWVLLMSEDEDSLSNVVLEIDDLEYIYIKSSYPTVIDPNKIKCPKLKAIYVPAASEDAYMDSWTQYADIINGYDFADGGPWND